MDKRNIIQENIFTTIAKMFAALQIQKKIGEVMDKLPEDPEIKKAAKRMKEADLFLRTSLHNFCKTNPDDPRCKEKSENK
jgi:hypothetical protein